MNTNPKSQARSTARLAAVQALYQRQMEGTKVDELLVEFHRHRLGERLDDEDSNGGEQLAAVEVDFFNDLVRGVDARRDEIDGVVTARLSEGWTLTRLDKTMVQILRAGTYELMARADVPTAAAINEYVEVAKAFFDDREAKFVNGILDAVAKEVRS
ncbi:transcription antitermination factor NusB [Erythrobacter sp. SCSIO 43205]|uniref:transcription antitermination factor NusB n=1 Tax=Erythrobacter sp. SCSIO 43205 TaxID=2779361 RepID=UPI001CA8B82E|nr:transcription antitermination factor NusB [Erythrobacter sp. SCSIO 43205]UAB79481.1 transcription antitermination factor NusB [Erythrobacter sp. SCSIO 43205]